MYKKWCAPCCRRNKSHGTVNLEKDDHLKQIFLTLFLIDILFVFEIIIYQIFSGISPTVIFSTQAILIPHITEIRLECRCLQKCFHIWNYYVGCLWAPLLVMTQSKETVFDQIQSLDCTCMGSFQTKTMKNNNLNCWSSL